MSNVWSPVRTERWKFPSGLRPRESGTEFTLEMVMERKNNLTESKLLSYKLQLGDQRASPVF